MNCLKMYACLLFLISGRARVTLQRFPWPGVGLGGKHPFSRGKSGKADIIYQNSGAVCETHTDKNPFSNCISRARGEISSALP